MASPLAIEISGEADKGRDGAMVLHAIGMMDRHARAVDHGGGFRRGVEPRCRDDLLRRHARDPVGGIR